MSRTQPRRRGFVDPSHTSPKARDPRLERAVLARAEALEQRWMLTIAQAPPMALPPVPEHSTAQFVVAKFTDTNASPANDYAATINFGDGSPISAGSVTTDGLGTYTVLGTHAYADEALNEILTVSVTENNPAQTGGPDTDSATLTTSLSLSESDTLTGTPVTFSPTENTAFSGAVATFSDTDTTSPASDFSASINWGDGTITAGTVSGSAGAFTVSGAHAYGDGMDGPQAVSVVLSDNAPGTATTTATGTVTVGEGTFVLNGVSPLSTPEGATLSTTVATFSDPNSTDASTAFGATINWGDGTTTSGTVSGTAGSYTVAGMHTYADEGAFTTNVTVTEPGANFTIGPNPDTVTVTEADTLSTLSGVISPGPTEASPTTATVGFSDTGYTGNTPADFTATINWGDGTTTSGGITEPTAGTYLVTGTHMYADEATGDVVTVTLKDDSPGTSAATFTGTVAPAEADVLGAVSAGFSTSPVEHSPSTLAAVFSDTNHSNTASDFNSLINWGDGVSTAGTVSGGGASNYTVTGTHTYADEGPFVATANLRDDAPGTASATASATITAGEADTLAGTLASFVATEGAAFTGQVATFSDTDTSSPASDFSAAINWGDGTTTAGTVSGSGGTFSVSGAHTYADGTDGAQSVTVTLADNAPGTAVGTASGTVVVAEAAGTFSVTSNIAPNFSLSEGVLNAATVANFSDAGSGPASDYTATIDWGDGTTQTATVSGSGGNYSVTGSHIYADEGANTVKTTINEPGANFSTTATLGTITATEADTLAPAASQPSVSVQEGGTLSSAVAVFNNSGYAANSAGDFTATINWGDGTTTTGAVSGGSGAPLTVSGSHAYAEDGSFTATVTIADDAPGIATATATNAVTVTEAQIIAHGTTFSGVEGNAFSNKLIATFTEPNAMEPAGGDTAAIFWGDGTSSLGTIVPAGVGPSGAYFNVFGSHTYKEQGNFFVEVGISDDNITRQITHGTAKIADAPLSLTGKTISATHGVTFTQTVAAMTDGDPLNTTGGDYHGTITWGDGTSSTASFSFVSPGHWNVRGSHKYAHSGAYKLKISVFDAPSSAMAAGLANVS